MAATAVAAVVVVAVAADDRPRTHQVVVFVFEEVAVVDVRRRELGTAVRNRRDITLRPRRLSSAPPPQVAPKEFRDRFGT
ncbi:MULTISPECIES: hypothetical protein [unclassified Streptomyces]|uniref:hypothetical protein n=1 Tax=unclassified Streptomyces TaxID=2593676 RepID=UPI0011648DB2|nr:MULTISPECIES: hypothetical protein [unclassified Streptomyces]QDN54868.1 hypothetical protein FNV67_05400 [Streptomyces sp. S1D4-20]QDN65048.1 hypothetical protein FNV66_05015 [Streptomyces sp. S1D4-14]QDO47455.1 hypothetical protein FNV60_03255 [Streptomyces sp. RLB3-5]QDO57694.1 hypothetical protein FNV59_05495 [Streptomyces sp. RLB1-8]